MKLWHCTLRRNRESIRRRGLSVAYSKGRRRAVWFHAKGETPWACGHCVLRHGGRLEEVIVLLVDVPDALVKRHGGRRELYYTLESVPEGCILGSIGWDVVYQSEVTDGD